MRIPLLLPAMVFAFIGFHPEAQSKVIDLTGNWKETRRLTEAKVPVDFKDTVRIVFLIGNEYVWQKDMGYAYRGTYKASETALDMGARYFTVVEMKKDRMLLKNEGSLFEFSRYTKPIVGTDNSQSTSSARANNEVTGPVDQALLAGKWETFKRTSAVKQERIDYTRLLKSININTTGGKISGAAYAAQRTPETGIWNIERYEGGVIYTSGMDKRSFKVLKCSDGELVLQEDTTTYFFKIFK